MLWEPVELLAWHSVSPAGAQLRRRAKRAEGASDVTERREQAGHGKQGGGSRGEGGSPPPLIYGAPFNPKPERAQR